ncbi:MAG TPA: asparagine synthase-related protein [Stenotrophomonas sp.]|nr:asparagine synthase-related protein [Stenotrophomonas sp.]
MTAIVGLYPATGPTDLAQRQFQIDLMLQTLSHRGGHAVKWVDSYSGVALGRCAAELGPSPCIGGPKHERFALAFDGCLSNRAQLASDLRDAGCDVDADAEDGHLVLHGVARWGLQRALTRCEGPFALALWDRHASRLTLAADRFGQRPLYYGWCGDEFIFTTEMKALRTHPRFDPRIDRGALAQLLRLDYIPAPRTIHEGIAKLAPGHWVTVEQDAAGAPTATPYWRADSLMAQAVQAREDQPSLEHTLDAVEDALGGAIDRAGMGSQPTLLLSGGVDSSLLAALMQARRSEPVDALTITFAHPDHDEEYWAAAVARHLRLRHHTVRMDGRLAAERVPNLAQTWCEPFADPSQLPTLLACQTAAGWTRRIHTGDGADELFFGHGAYVRAMRNHRFAERTPATLRRVIGCLPASAPEAARLGGWAAVREALAGGGLEASYLRRISRWREPGRALGGIEEPRLAPLLAEHLGGKHLDDSDRIQLFDLQMDLPFGVLTKLDRAAGSQGLSVCCPFLDMEVARLGWSLPLAMKQRHGQQKYLLRQLLARHLPGELVWRSKRGFGPPISDWLAGPLQDWAHSLLAPERLRAQGWFDAALIDQLWREFRGGRRKWHTHLWNVLMFQAWHAHWLESPPVPPDIVRPADLSS